MTGNVKSESDDSEKITSEKSDVIMPDSKLENSQKQVQKLQIDAKGAP